MESLWRDIVDQVRRRRDDLLDLTATLIGFDTRAGGPGDGPREEAALQECLASRLQAAGLEVELWEPQTVYSPRGATVVSTAEHFRGRPQLLARAFGGGGGRSLLLNGHIDVVPAEPRERWATDPFVAHLRGGRLYGRGACDMKGGVAAMVVAVEALHALQVPLCGDLFVNTVTDEESTGAGALATVARGVRADGGIIPEPTALAAWLGARGSLLPRITVSGRPGHAALVHPHHTRGGAVNAVDKMRVVLDVLERLRDDWARRHVATNPGLAAGDIVFTSIEAGEWMVSHPATCTLRCHVQYCPEQGSPDGFGEPVEREIEERIGQAAAADSWLRDNPPHVDWPSQAVPAGTVPPEAPIASTLLDTLEGLGRGRRIASRTTLFDAPTFTAAGTPSIGCGPGDITVAHATDEHVEVDELVRAAEVLAITAMRFCGVVGERRPRSLRRSSRYGSP